MERIIKFRIWDSEKKRMSKDVPVFTPIIQWDDGDIDMPTDFAVAGAQRFLFLQYCGLKDKNGKEIYEGDIVELVNDAGLLVRAVCEFGTVRRQVMGAELIEVDIHGFYFKLSNGKKTFPIVNNYAGKHDLQLFSVCGNIYETPELLKP